MKEKKPPLMYGLEIMPGDKSYFLLALEKHQMEQGSPHYDVGQKQKEFDAYLTDEEFSRRGLTDVVAGPVNEKYDIIHWCKELYQQVAMREPDLVLLYIRNKGGGLEGRIYIEKTEFSRGLPERISKS